MCNRKLISGISAAKGLFLVITSAILVFSTAGTSHAAERIHGSVEIDDEAVVVVGMPTENDTHNKGDPDDVDIGSSENKVVVVVGDEPEKNEKDGGFLSGLFGRKGSKEETVHGSVEMEDDVTVIVQHDDDEVSSEEVHVRESSSSSTKSSTKPMNDIPDFVSIVDNEDADETETAEEETETVEQEEAEEPEEKEADVVEKGHLGNEEPQPAVSIIKAGADSDENEVIYDESNANDVIYDDNEVDNGAEIVEDTPTNEPEGEEITEFSEEDIPDEDGNAHSGDGYYIPDPPSVSEEPIEEPEAAQDIREAGGGDENLYEPDETEESEATPSIEYPEYAEGEGEDILLAKLIFHEAGNQPYAGRVAVAEVVMNRVYSGLFPDNIYDVIYQPGQFSYNHRIAGSPVTEENLGIARRVIDSSERVFYNPEVLYFRNPMVTSGIPQSERVDWGRHTWYSYIGGHTFYTQN